MPLSTLGTVLTWTGIAGCLLFGSYSFIMIAASMGGARLLRERGHAKAAGGDASPRGSVSAERTASHSHCHIAHDGESL